MYDLRQACGVSGPFNEWHHPTGFMKIVQLAITLFRAKVTWLTRNTDIRYGPFTLSILAPEP